MSGFEGQTEIERKLAAEAAARAEAERAPAEPAEQEMPRRRKGLLARWSEKGGVLGGIAAALIAFFKVVGPVFALLGKLKIFVVLGKLLLMFGSMAISVWAYSLRYGVEFGIGIVLLLFVHESGHALAAMSKGIKPGFMVFVPFMGALVTTGRGGQSLEEDAFIGIMGPVFGTIGGVVCVVLAFATSRPFFMSLAYTNFFLNLFNLIPTAPLDGGWIAPLFSPKVLVFGVVLLLLVGFANPMIWVLGLMSLGRILSAWKADPATQPYYRVTAAAKWKYGLSYVGLILFLVAMMAFCMGALQGVL